MNSRDYGSSAGTSNGDASGKAASMFNYLERPAEQLVLEGYRSWTAACIQRSTSELDRCWQLYESSIEGRAAQIAFNALGDFIQTLGRCASCPLQTHLAGCPNICRHEVMVLGLVAALQIGDEDAAKLCLNSLGCPAQRERIEIAALHFAITLRALGHTLVPIPAPVIAQLPEDTARPVPNPDHHSPTLH
ncbi:MAG: hypothetical protein AAF737_03880 [Pseudomonadota bacterium]